MSEKFKFNIGDKLYHYKIDTQGFITKTELTVNVESNECLDFEHKLESGEMSCGYIYESSLDIVYIENAIIVPDINYYSLGNISDEFFKNIVKSFLAEEKIKLQNRFNAENEKLDAFINKLN